MIIKYEFYYNYYLYEKYCLTKLKLKINKQPKKLSKID